MLGSRGNRHRRHEKALKTQENTQMCRQGFGDFRQYSRYVEQGSGDTGSDFEDMRKHSIVVGNGSRDTMLGSLGSGDFDSRKGLFGVRISRGSTNITFLYLAGSGDFASVEGLSGVRIFGERTDIVFLPFGGVRSSTPEKVGSGDFNSREGLSRARISKGSMNIPFFHLAGSGDFNSSEGLSRVRIIGGSTDIVYFLSVWSKAFDSRDGLSLVRIIRWKHRHDFLPVDEREHGHCLLSLGLEDFDPREWLFGVRISGWCMDIAFFYSTESGISTPEKGSLD
ncbi:hypothetical protein TIFTF001_023164 [Ficus carica]|uniref:Uncharacterized protein n=1 Tax=Ficus carica TaxID=3494 RepID=A0AA88DF48_FICCA|nr:hypothetical protein TIFTF001_023164 [Ficus carica]